MKAIKLILIPFLMICFSTTYAGPSNESAASKIQRAMKAAPSSISAGAEIRDVDADWTILRPGEPGNTWTCFPGVPVNPGDKHPMCNDEVWMAWFWDVKTLIESKFTVWTHVTETIGYSYMLRGDALVNNDDAMGGPLGTWDQEGPHLMILYPTGFDLSYLPDSPNAGGPYVMWGGGPLVHVMVPLTDRDR
jgi:hypothetical protein